MAKLVMVQKFKKWPYVWPYYSPYMQDTAVSFILSYLVQFSGSNKV